MKNFCKSKKSSLRKVGGFFGIKKGLGGKNQDLWGWVVGGDF